MMINSKYVNINTLKFDKYMLILKLPLKEKCWS